MSSKIPPLFKPITPFIRRAEELERDTSRAESRLVAYYSRQYAMELGIKLRENDPSSEEAMTFLLSLMDRLEKDKASMPVFSPEEGKQICEAFAYDVFTKADDEDRSGNANKNTARTFYAAGSFFDILKQFGEPSEEVIEKCRYSKWKAADILKAIKEGRTPTQGAPGEEEEPPIAAPPAGEAATNVWTIPEAPHMPPEAPSRAPVPMKEKDLPWQDDGFPNSATFAIPEAPQVSPEPYSQPIIAPMGKPMNALGLYPQHEIPPATPIANSRGVDAAPIYSPKVETKSAFKAVPSKKGTMRQENIDDAMELAKFAVAALKSKDVGLAIDRLEKALAQLR